MPPTDGTKGILPDHMIAELAKAGGIRPVREFAPDQIQPASLDLRLGRIAYRVRASFLPGPQTTVAERIAELRLHEIALTGGAVLETNCVYIVPLLESLALPDDVAAAANPKSSTGRIDVFTRVIADRTRGFDRIEAGYRGRFTPRSVQRRFRCWCARVRGCRRFVFAVDTVCSAQMRFARCTTRSGSRTMPPPMSAMGSRSVSTSRVSDRTTS